jgi:hypothetical protein
MAYKPGDSEIMNNEMTMTPEHNPLDALFASARQAQPNLMDDNFTKSLMNSLPKVTLSVRRQTVKKGLSFDMFGAIIGLLMAYLFIDRNSLAGSFLSLIPESLVISPLLLVGVIGVVGLSSALVWWAVEDNRL